MHPSTKRTLIVTAAALALVVGACGPARPPAHKEQVKVIHTKDGRYAYEDDGVWYWYYLTQSANQPPAVSSGGLPGGGAWVKGSAPTESELEGSQTESIQLEVMAEGEPAIEAESVKAAVDGNYSAEVSDVSADVSSGAVDAGSVDSGGGGGDGGGGGGE